jgi:DNA polymerase zeta
MARIAKPESFLLLSPNRADVGNQNAAECIPLIMEPNSAFFKGPLLVLDFQSLYPSVMIAYNYCYSTCLGRVDNFKGTQKLGISKTDLAPGILNLLQDDINISANGLMFVKPEIRKSLLAKMLTELLDTRVMVKSSMKGVKDDKVSSSSFIFLSFDAVLGIVRCVS